jgi:hypothetical protein
MTDARIAGLVLVAAAISSLVAATMPSLSRERVWMLPLPDYLRVIRAHETEWRAHAWLFAVGTVLMGIALGLIARLLASGLATAAAVAYWAVAPLWLADLAFRLDITVWASRETEAQPVFTALGHWAGTLFNIFMIGAYFAIALLGAALVESTVVPAWCAWVLVVFGTAAGLSHWAARPGLMGMRSPFDLPVLVQLVPLFVAIPLAAGG